jgi:hypothetical protein
MKTTDYEARYVTISILLLFILPRVKIFSSAFSFKTPSVLMIMIIVIVENSFYVFTTLLISPRAKYKISKHK